MADKKKFEELFADFFAAGEGGEGGQGGDGGAGGNGGGQGGGGEETVEALKAKVADLEAKLSHYEQTAQTLLDAATSGMNDAQKGSLENIYTTLNAENPLQKLVTVNTVKASKSRIGVDNSRSGPSNQPPRAKNKNDFHNSLAGILKNQK